MSKVRHERRSPAKQMLFRNLNPLLQTLAGTLRLHAKRWLHLTAELKELDATLEQLTAQTAKRFRSQFGIGP